MDLQLITTGKVFAFSVLVVVSGRSWAGGNHAGGHDHVSHAIGVPGDVTQVSRSIVIRMTDDMRFTPSTIKVSRDETVRFEVSNAGKVRHEFTLGTQADLKAHYALMKKFPDMQHEEPNTVSLQPGANGVIVWKFTKAGDVHFACLHPGHYEAGMKGKVQVQLSDSTRSTTAVGR